MRRRMTDPLHRTMTAVLQVGATTAIITGGLTMSACSHDSNRTTNSPSSMSPQEKRDRSASTTVTGSDGIVVMNASQSHGLQDGQKVVISVKDADPEMGYYLAVCTKENTGTVPNCLGKHGDSRAQKWISNENQDGAITRDGAFREEISVTQKNVSTRGDDIDCKTQECVIKLFGDHSNGFVDIADIPITFK